MSLFLASLFLLLQIQKQHLQIVFSDCDTLAFLYETVLDTHNATQRVPRHTGLTPEEH